MHGSRSHGVTAYLPLGLLYILCDDALRRHVPARHCTTAPLTSISVLDIGASVSPYDSTCPGS